MMRFFSDSKGWYIPVIRFFGVAAVCLGLMACGGGGLGDKYIPTTVAKTPSQHVFALKVEHEGLLELMTEYNALPRCAITDRLVCSHQSIVELMRKVNDAADKALDGAEGVVRDPAAASSTVNLAVESARTAVGVVKSVLGENGLLR